ncbi:MAG: hypothetical protein HUU02_08370 [Bacteroidetes bacterium]|nr:hypothetical protein [Bacteroidota bacterium]
MKGSIIIALLLAVLLTAVSCENVLDGEPEYEEAVAYVESFRVDTVAGPNVTLSFICMTPTPCWSFSRVEEVRSGRSAHFTLYRKLKRNVTCIQVIGSFTHTMQVTVQDTGAFTFKVYRTPTTTLDTTIVL